MTVIKETLLFAPSSGGGKEYKVLLTADGSGTYAVDAYYGPAGNLRQCAAQGSGLTIEAAEVLYFKAIKKKANGSGSSVYTVTSQVDNSGGDPIDTSAFGSLQPAREVSSPYQAQLLTSLDDESELRRQLRSGAYIAQVKADGDRVMCHSKDGVITFFNRKGQVRMGSNPAILAAVEKLDGDFFLDGEIVGETYYLFDFLRKGKHDLRDISYETRFLFLLKHIANAESSIKAVKTVLPEDGFDAQWALFEEIRDTGEEGIVLHLAVAGHEPGKNHRHLKFKLKERSTCIVGSVNQKRSVSLLLIDDSGVKVDVGNCSVPVNYEIPAPGDLVEIEYLYKFEAGSLFQPVYKGKRSDIDQEECTLSQVRRYKNQLAMAD